MGRICASSRARRSAVILCRAQNPVTPMSIRLIDTISSLFFRVLHFAADPFTILVGSHSRALAQPASVVI